MKIQHSRVGHSRRRGVFSVPFLSLVAVLAFVMCAHAQPQNTPTTSSAGPTASKASDDPPPSAMLQPGDLLWPKVPGAWVPYGSKPATEEEKEEAEWTRERDEYLQRLRDKPNPTNEEKERYKALANLDYPTFKVMYHGDADPTQMEKYGSSAFYVGHVGIVDIVDGKPWVYEAINGIGVRAISYSDWVSERKGELVWLGRLTGATPAQRAKIATVAHQYIGKPYRFFNFDLSDTSGFYCSKLAWFSITTAVGSPPDDDANPHRMLWYSPKRLMRSSHITLVYNPGNYAVR